mgnify:FL=1
MTREDKIKALNAYCETQNICAACPLDCLCQGLTMGKGFVSASDEDVNCAYDLISKDEPERSAVDHPKHYNVGGIEVIDAIEAWKLGFNLGNVVKYVARADYKSKPLEDLKKAKWYLEREIERRSKR